MPRQTNARNYETTHRQREKPNQCVLFPWKYRNICDVNEVHEGAALSLLIYILWREEP